MLKIWGRVNSVNVQKVMWAVAELGLEHERIDAGLQFGVVDTPEYGALNPNRRIPTIEDNGLVLWESNVIVRYLAATYGAGTLWSEDPRARAEADRWMDWQQTTGLPNVNVAFLGLIRTPPEKRDTAAIDAAIAQAGKDWATLDAHLARHPYVGGENFTMGDIPIGATCHRYMGLDIARPPLPALEDWFARLKQREPYRAHVVMPLT